MLRRSFHRVNHLSASLKIHNSFMAGDKPTYLVDNAVHVLLASSMSYAMLQTLVERRSTCKRSYMYDLIHRGDPDGLPYITK